MVVRNTKPTMITDGDRYFWLNNLSSFFYGAPEIYLPESPNIEIASVTYENALNTTNTFGNSK